MKIHIITIEHKYGTNAYAAVKFENVKKQLADYCKEWWKHQVTKYDGPEMPKEDDDIIETYFDFNQDCEWYMEHISELKI